MRQVLMFLSLFALGGYALGNAVGYVYVEDWLLKRYLGQLEARK
ncbi:MAG: hypothetical protein ACK4SM_06555 [Aquificaceae bacterium]